MKVHLRVDSVGPEHIRETVFIDGRNCGQLCLGIGEYQLLGAALQLGANITNGALIVETTKLAYDKEGHFRLPDIGDWYEARRLEANAAFKKLQEAREAGAPADEIRKLERAYEQAAYVGD